MIMYSSIFIQKPALMLGITSGTLTFKQGVKGKKFPYMESFFTFNTYLNIGIPGVNIILYANYQVISQFM